ncbi:lipopolysaccharide heptosyltransferase II [Neisseria animalis]|uniref:lipopolysaccharide heptosyltransferase II n=1 Tax=Neisseria animalis TaxID=492 RepID=A0A5P3MS42_NEIAN|nr:lipopolysaccharide heptosyltransferase II [Neisseria animalis]QEY24412.1 lipopolysaccharide heptosyltransferase II [Neisseria animalis]ROW31888.1 lipopolysaccharide heptosyltransferase II [Neisseria animalis]VEE07002.1 ADP-heptose--LPS heptosyltransferase II [Neisseria animalis]
MPKKILIISPSWIGDCVMTQPLYRRLHQLHPGCTIDVFAPKWSMAVFERMPEVNRIIENPFGHGALQLKKRWQIGRELGKQGYDQVIVLPGSLKSAIIAFATGIRQRTGYVGESRYILLNDIRKLDKAALPLMVDRYTALAYPSQSAFNGVSDNPLFTINPDEQSAALAKHGLDTAKPVIAFCPGAEYGPAKRWPARHFAELALRYIRQGRQVWLFGSQKDFAIAEEINRFADGLCTNLCGKTTLSEAIDLLACAETVVCNDSGLMHLAAALDRKVIAVYGSSSPDHTPPLSPKAKIISLNLECSPCFKRECPLGHTDCLNKLMPDTVYQAARED